VKIDPDGYKLTGIIFCCALILLAGHYITQWQFLFWCSGFVCLLAVFSLFFFRDPERTGPEDKHVCVSAADGIVVDVSHIEAEGFEGSRALRIAVFMNIFNVHVNRCPLSGKVVKTSHRSGKKLSALNKRAEYENEYGDIDIKTPSGFIRIRQIAGLIARRVVTRVEEGDVLNRGERLGIIRFGSRVDVFLPEVFKPVVNTGDRVLAGETIIAQPVIDESLTIQKSQKEHT